MAIAHFNVARLLYPPGDPRVAEFTSNTVRVNLVAERSPGFLWRWKDEASTVDGSGGYQAVDDDPNLAISLSVWASVAAFRFFVQKSINAYIKALEANDIVAKVRRSRGKDIDAACGQLANKEA